MLLQVIIKDSNKTLFLFARGVFNNKHSDRLDFFLKEILMDLQRSGNFSQAAYPIVKLYQYPSSFSTSVLIYALPLITQKIEPRVVVSFEPRLALSNQDGRVFKMASKSL